MVSRLALMFLLLCSWQAFADECDIVYGEGWAFVMPSVQGWSPACMDRAMEGTAVSLWPSHQGARDSDAVMYVTVNMKAGRTLGEFQEEELASFREASPQSRVAVLPTNGERAGLDGHMVHIANAPGAHDEFVAYLEGPGAFYVLVLSADTPELAEHYKPAYLQFLRGFSAMKRN